VKLTFEQTGEDPLPPLPAAMAGVKLDFAPVVVPSVPVAVTTATMYFPVSLELVRYCADVAPEIAVQLELLAGLATELEVQRYHA
jgi:hypothetical protein